MIKPTGQAAIQATAMGAIVAGAGYYAGGSAISTILCGTWVWTGSFVRVSRQYAAIPRQRVWSIALHAGFGGLLSGVVIAWLAQMNLPSTLAVAACTWCSVFLWKLRRPEPPVDPNR